MKCCAKLEQRVYHPSDGPSVRFKKKVALLQGSFLAVSYVVYILYYILTSHYNLFLLIPAVTFAVIPAIVVLIYLFVTRRVLRFGIELSMVNFGIGLILVDITQAGETSAFFGLVLVMDGLLLSRCQVHVSNTLAILGTIYITLLSLDQTFGIGLFTFLPVKQPERVSTVVGLNLWMNRVVVFLVDYFATRYCAVSMYKEQARMAQMVTLAEQVGEALGKYDLESAGEMVEVAEERGDCEKLCSVLNTLLQNLEDYRAYLPHSVICGVAGDCSQTDDRSESGSSSHFSLGRIYNEQKNFDATENIQNLVLHKVLAGHTLQTKRGSLRLRKRKKQASRFIQGLGAKYVAVAEVRLVHDEAEITASSSSYLEHVGQLFLGCLFSAADSSRGMVVRFNAVSASVTFGVLQRISQAQIIQDAQNFSDQLVGSMQPHLDFLERGGFKLGIGVAEGTSIVGYVGTRDHSSFNVLGKVPWVAESTILPAEPLARNDRFSQSETSERLPSEASLTSAPGDPA